MTNPIVPERLGMDQVVYDFLAKNSIAYERCDHAPVYTCAEADLKVPPMPGTRTKNLFLRDRKGKRHFLLVVRPEQTVDLSALSELLGVTKLGMASPERLQTHLGVEPGSVSFLALLHDQKPAVEVIIEESGWSSTHILCHPMVNTSTLVLSKQSALQILASTGHQYHVVIVPERLPQDSSNS